MIGVEWDNEQAGIVRMSFNDAWTQEDYADAFLRILELIEGTHDRLDLINLIGPNVILPRGALEVIHSTLRQMPRQFVMIVTVSGGKEAEAMTATLDDRLALTNVPFTVRTADTLTQARILIAEDRSRTGNRTPVDSVDSEDAEPSF